jgi:pyruvate dehydrogenase E2 component (dihydrolipoamide acetyltransferase)
MRELLQIHEDSPSISDQSALSFFIDMSSDQGQPIPLLLPQAGNSMEEGTILAWRVEEGARVKPGDILYELETDKATLEVEAESAGRISRIVVKEGQTAAVKSPVAYLSESDAAVDALLGGGATPADAPAALAPVSLPTAPDHALAVGDVLMPSRKRVSPAARRAAEALGVDLALVEGSGPGERVLVKDVEAAGSRPRETRPPAPAPAPISGPQPIRPVLSGSRSPMTKMRKAIAKGLTLSKQTLPHWQLKLTIDADPLLAYYRKEKALYTCSLNDVIVLAVARAVLEFPIFRTQVDGDDLVEISEVNIGLAVGLDQGLVVPVIKSADGRNLKGIAQESRRLIELAKTGKVEGMGEGVFTISNLGMFGVEEFTAIINPPESGILAVGAAREEVVVKDGLLKIGRKMTLVLSADHRTIDGTTGAKFMARLKELLENPSSLGGS